MLKVRLWISLPLHKLFLSFFFSLDMSLSHTAAAEPKDSDNTPDSTPEVSSENSPELLSQTVSNAGRAEQPDFSACIRSLGLDHIKRHIFICADQTKPKCCSKALSIESWDYLKRRLKELKLDTPTEQDAGCIFRTKANCLRVCQNGPILLIYPDGVWYHSATPDVIERIIQEHLLQNQIVTEYAFLTQPMAETASPEPHRAAPWRPQMVFNWSESAMVQCHCGSPLLSPRRAKMTCSLFSGLLTIILSLLKSW